MSSHFDYGERSHLLSRSICSLWRGAVGAAAVVTLINTWAVVVGPEEAERSWFLLDSESSPAAWLNASLFLGASALALLCGLVDGVRVRRFWRLLALAFGAMSLDEVATVHERVGGNLVDTAGGMPYYWVVPWSVLAMIVALGLWRWRPHPAPVRMDLLLLGGAIFLGGAVGLEILGGLIRDGGTTTEWDPPFLLVSSVEEVLEMAGILLVLRSLIAQIESLEVTIRSRSIAEP